MIEHILKAILALFPPVMQILLSNTYKYMVVLPRALYLRIACLPLSRKTECGHDIIMRNLDRWASKHDSRGYIPGDFVPGVTYGMVKQVREEISEFVNILLRKNLKDNILEIGLSEGGTHMLWRLIFDHIISIEISAYVVRVFKLCEWLDSRSTVIVGNSNDPRTLEKVRGYMDSIDVLFIDGDHTCESVAADWSMYHNLVKPGGIIAFHDCVDNIGTEGTVDKFLDDLSNGVVDNKHYTLHQIVYSNHIGIAYYEQP